MEVVAASFPNCSRFPGRDKALMPNKKGAPCGAPFKSSAEGGNDVPSVIGDDLLLIAAVEIDVELGDTRRLQFM